MKNILLLFICFLVVSCKDVVNEKYNSTLVSSVKEETMLFMIDENDKVSGQLLVVLKNSDRLENNVILPFAVKEIKNSKDLLSTSAIYDDFAVINYKYMPSSLNIQRGIEFEPSVFIPDNEGDVFRELKEGVCIVKSGLERRFIYRNDLQMSLHRRFNNVLFKRVNYVVVKLPNESKGVEIKQGKTTIPDPILDENGLKHFDLKSSDDKVVVSYMVSANSKQRLFGEVIAKFLGVSVFPVIELAFIRPNRRLSARVKKWVLYSAIIVHMLLLGVLAYLSLVVQVISTDKYMDLGMIGLGMVFALIMYRWK